MSWTVELFISLCKQCGLSFPLIVGVRMSGSRDMVYDTLVHRQ